MPSSSASITCRARTLAPGLTLVAAATALAFWLNSLINPVSALLFALALGVLTRNAGALRPAAWPGIKAATKKSLRIGVVLLGFQLSIPNLVALGWQEVLIIVATVGITFGVTVLLGRLLRVSRSASLLIAAGFSICGASAVAAMASVTLPESEQQADDDAATAVALITLFGSIAILVMPLLQGPSGFSDQLMGIWIGASVHEVAQVVAAASGISALCVTVATLTKLGRVVLLAPMIALVGVMRRIALPEGQDEPHVAASDTQGKTAKPPLVPLFVFGFLAAIAIRSWVPLPAWVFADIKPVATCLLAAAMFCLGTGVHVPTLVRTGARPALLGLFATLTATAVAFGAIVLLHPPG